MNSNTIRSVIADVTIVVTFAHLLPANEYPPEINNIIETNNGGP